jgi:hypothetical protein
VGDSSDRIETLRVRHGEAWGEFARRWVARSQRTEACEPREVAAAVERAYALAGRAKPRVVVVPSPGVLAFAGPFAAQVWAIRARQPGFEPLEGLSGALRIPSECEPLASAVLAAVRTATAGTAVPGPAQQGWDPPPSAPEAILAATYSPADVATVEALDRDSWLELRGIVEELDGLRYWVEVVRDAMRDPFGNTKPTELMAKAIEDWAQPLAEQLFAAGSEAEAAVRSGLDWWTQSQAGNLWLHDTACIAAARDLRGLELPAHQAFGAWEDYIGCGGYRYLHPQFCLVSDFPAWLDEASVVDPREVRPRPLAQHLDAPVMRWRDGWVI